MGEELRTAGVSVDELGLRGRIYGSAGVAAVRRLRAIVRGSGASIVHTFLFDADFVGAIVGRLAGARVITTRRAIKRGKTAQLWAYRLTNRWADRIVANSEEVRRFTLGAEKPPPAKVRTIPNGIDIERIAAGNGTRFRAALGLPDSAFLIGSSGTVKPVKGQDILFEACLPLLREHPNVVVLVAGSADSDLARALRERALSAGVEDRFRLLGNREDVPDFLAALDLFVLPSRSEGMSNALIEAMAAGRPCVATRVGGNAEALAEGATGRIVPPENPESLRAAVAGLLADPGSRAALGSLARERAAREYDLPVMLERTEQVYQEVLAPGPRVR
jgi:glycosyltransferase involved in cell wall biosynthesis